MRKNEKVGEAGRQEGIRKRAMRCDAMRCDGDGDRDAACTDLIATSIFVWPGQSLL